MAVKHLDHSFYETCLKGTKTDRKKTLRDFFEPICHIKIKMRLKQTFESA